MFTTIALAAIFIKPLTILLAEATRLAHGDATADILACFIDTTRGALIGFAGGWMLQSSRWRGIPGSGLRELMRRQDGPETWRDEPDGSRGRRTHAARGQCGWYGLRPRRRA